jgi:stearoyl-CoA desaturase (Delta-9 desaturase)
MPLRTTSLPHLAPRPVEDDEQPADGAARAITALIVGLPVVALVLGVVLFWGHGVQLRDVLLAGVLYVLIGHGMTIGFHRLLAHKSFTARRPLKLVLVALGSMAYEGDRSVGWRTTDGTTSSPTRRRIHTLRNTTAVASVVS